MRTKVLSFFAILLIAFTLTSCQAKEERVISNMEKLAERIESDGEGFNNEDWDAVFVEYEQLQKEAAQCEFTQDQIKELGRVEGKLAAKLTKERAKSLDRDFKNLLESGKNYIDGFVEGLKEE
jgi:hypothetical protein